MKISKRKYEKLIVVGAWDRFHLGHKAIIRRAFGLASHVFITICKLSSVHPEPSYLDKVQPFKTRRKNVERFVKELGCGSRVTYVVVENEDEVIKTRAAKMADAVIISDKDLTNPCIMKTLQDAFVIRKTRYGLDSALEVISAVREESGAIISASKMRKREYLKMKKGKS